MKLLKKVRETDAIFQNVLQENRASDARRDSLRISIDSQAKLNLGEFSGRERYAHIRQLVIHLDNTSFASHPNAIPGEVLRQRCSGEAAT